MNHQKPKEIILFSNEFNITELVTQKLNLTPIDVFYYVYGVLHSSEFREKYSNELQKSLPNIPIYKNKDLFVEIGKNLVSLHLNYESIPSLDSVIVEIKANATYKVKKMRYGSKNDKSTIIFNSDITIKNIPLKAYEYIVNGKPAIQWIMEQYSVPNKTTSGIIDDPNTYSENPKYILNLLLSIISLSVETVDLISNLPSLQVEDTK